MTAGQLVNRTSLHGDSAGVVIFVSLPRVPPTPSSRWPRRGRQCTCRRPGAPPRSPDGERKSSGATWYPAKTAQTCSWAGRPAQGCQTPGSSPERPRDRPGWGTAPFFPPEKLQPAVPRHPWRTWSHLIGRTYGQKCPAPKKATVWCDHLFGSQQPSC